MLRGQILATAVLLSLFSAWQLETRDSLLAPAALAATAAATLLASLATRGGRSRGQAALEAWAALPNSGFWVIPAAAALIGPAGVALATLADRVGAAHVAFSVHLLRKDAPTPQQRRTAPIDHAPLLALAAGLALRPFGAAPAWSSTVLAAAGPVLAASGASLYVSSVRLTRQGAAGRIAGGGVTRWASLIGLRAALVLSVVWLLDDPVATAVGVLGAFSAPAFNPPQLALLYGYDAEAVRAASRYGWLLAPVGLTLALLVV
jgi:predicted permease